VSKLSVCIIIVIILDWTHKYGIIRKEKLSEPLTMSTSVSSIKLKWKKGWWRVTFTKLICPSILLIAVFFGSLYVRKTLHNRHECWWNLINRHTYKKKYKFQRTFILTKNTISKEKKTFMSSLLTIPVELVYRILDNLDQRTLLLSVRNVCTRLNLITDKYHRYKVNASYV
jgi:hypothetical protein